MRKIISARWFWITVAFAVINVLGLLAIFSALQGMRRGIPGARSGGLQLRQIRQTDMTPDHEVTLAFEFNDIVSPESLSHHLTFTAANGDEVDCEALTWRPEKTLGVRTESVGGDKLFIKLSEGLRSAGDKNVLSGTVTQEISLDKELRISSVEACAGGSVMHVHCTQALDPKNLRDFVRVEPAAEFTTTTQSFGFDLNGPFACGRRYRLTFLKGMKSQIGFLLGSDVVRIAVVPDNAPEMRFKTRGIYLSKEGNRLLPLETVNVKEADVSIERVYDNNIVYYFQSRHSEHGHDYGRNMVTRRISCAGKTNETTVTNIDLGAFLGKYAYGVFYVTACKHVETASAENQDWYVSPAQQLVLITDMGLTVKKADSEMLVWVNSLSTAEPVPGATVAVYTKTNQKILEGTTDASGLAHFTDSNWTGDREPFVVTAAKSGDAAVLELSAGALDISSFDTGGTPYLTKGYEAFLYGDRDIYRPDEKVHLHAIVRGAGPSLPGRFPVQFRIQRPDGAKFRTYTAQLSDWGSAEAEVEMPAYAMTGEYAAQVTLPDGTALGRGSYRVEEFIPDRMKVELKAEDRRFHAGEKIPVTVKGTQLFGSPAADRRVAGGLRFVASEFTHPDYKEFSFGDWTKAISTSEVSLGEATLDEKGEKIFNVEIPADLKPPAALTVFFTATVHEVGGRAVTARLSRRVDVYPHYVGIARARQEYAAPNREEKLRCILITPEGARVAEGELKAVVSRVTWNTVLKLDNGHYRYQSERDEKKLADLTAAVHDGAAEFSFTPDIVGQYEARVTDTKGGASALLTFYCSGEGDVPWSMEKPDRLKLEMDKPSYSAGDTAHVLIQSPFPGAALLTVEGDRIRLVRAFTLEKNTQDIAVPIEASFGSNVYCAVTVIRKVDPQARWATHRAYGFAPIKLDNATHRLKVEIASDPEVRPGRSLHLRLNVTDGTGAGKRAEVTLAAVDEGILLLTDFTAPNPWSLFYSERRLAVNTSDIYSLLMPEVEKKKVGSDSDAGGGGSDDESRAPRLLNPVHADRVKPVALWKSQLETAEDGHVETDLDIPAHFTGQLRLMVVAATAQDFGKGEQDVFVRQPLMIQTSLPRFLAPEDEFEVPVTLHNAGQSGEVSVNADASSGLEFLTGSSATVSVPGGGERTVSFRMRAPKLPGVVKFNVRAALGAESASEEVEIAVRPTSPLQFLSGCGRITADSSGMAMADFTVPGGWMPKTEQYAISFSARPTLKLAGALRYVLRYPYGCVEQTTSSAFPLLYLSDLAAVVDPERFQKEEVGDFVRAGIERLLTMQSFNGGFCMWPEGGAIYPWGSVYATHFLVEADKAGYAVPKEKLDAALGCLDRLLGDRENEDEEFELPVKAYACYVLALAGRPNVSWTFRLYEDRQDLPEYSRFHIAAALALQNERALANPILHVEPLTAPPAFTPDTGGLLNSPARETAILLATYMDVDPDNARVPALVESLDAAMTGGRWMSTQENAFALMALGKYARRLKQQKTEFRAELVIGGKLERTFTQDDFVNLRPEALGGQRVQIKLQGAGSLFYYWSAEGVPQSGDAPEKDQVLSIRRRFLSRDGRTLDPAHIRLGEVVLVELSVKAEKSVENVVITDLLPAGFEIENPRIATSESVDANAVLASPARHGRHRRRSADAPPAPIENTVIQSLYPRRVDMRDDRLLVFVDLGSQGEYVYRYVVRAVAKGRFKLPPVSASCMYQPYISSLNGAGRIEVTDGR